MRYKNINLPEFASTKNKLNQFSLGDALPPRPLLIPKSVALKPPYLVFGEAHTAKRLNYISEWPKNPETD